MKISENLAVFFYLIFLFRLVRILSNFVIMLNKKLKHLSKKISSFIIKLIIAGFLFSVLQVICFKWIPLPFSFYMISERIEMWWNNNPKYVFKYQWVSLDKISNHMQTAVIASEDQTFVQHFGLDIDSIEKAIEYNKKSKKIRGASTITQQTVKNVFLWSGKSYFRKGLEVYYSFLVELIWGKERILEVYLNVIEIGLGVYGVEAAANKYFKKSASQLNRYESSLFTVVLPNPKRFNVAKPSSYMIRRQTWILEQMYKLSPDLKIDSLD